MVPRINDGLVAKASEFGDDSEEAKPYLAVLLAASGVLYTGSLCAIGAMFHYFQGCPANELVMSLTLILAVVSVLGELCLFLQRSCRRGWYRCCSYSREGR